MEPKRGTPDFVLFFLTLALVGFGLVMIASASQVIAYWYRDDPFYFVKRQLASAGVGLVALFVAMNIPYRVYKRFFLLIAGASFLFLLTVFLPGVGKEVNGARGWITLGSLQLQPAEFAKLGLVLYLSALIAKKGERFRDFQTGLLPPLIVTGLFFLVILLQNDLGTGLVLIATAGIVLVVGGANLRHLMKLGALALALITGLVFMASYRVKRFTAFLDPWSEPQGASYQLIQSLYAIAHGGVTGAGFGQSIQKYFYLPFPHTDFIFAVFAEEFGFIGCVLFVFVYVLFLWRMLILSLRCPDPYAHLLGTGIVGMIAIQALINLGGVTGMLPITGVPLPFISYGGSSLIVCMTATGLVLSLSREAARRNARVPVRHRHPKVRTLNA
ncbi:MAG TPA: putative lipid II flippase FtsW [Calditerricola sp.]